MAAPKWAAVARRRRLRGSSTTTAVAWLRHGDDSGAAKARPGRAVVVAGTAGHNMTGGWCCAAALKRVARQRHDDGGGATMTRRRRWHGRGGRWWRLGITKAQLDGEGGGGAAGPEVAVTRQQRWCNGGDGGQRAPGRGSGDGEEIGGKVAGGGGARATNGPCVRPIKFKFEKN